MAHVRNARLSSIELPCKRHCAHLWFFQRPVRQSSKCMVLGPPSSIPFGARLPSTHTAAQAALQDASHRTATSSLRRRGDIALARENEVIARDLLGEKTHSTSDAMGIAPGTISTLRSRARKKLNISAHTDLERLVRDGKIHLDNPADPPANNHLSWKCLAISLLAALSSSHPLCRTP